MSFKQRYPLSFYLTAVGGLALLVMGWLSLPVRAQQAISPSIGINPALVKKDIPAGQNNKVALALSNYGKDAIPLSASKLNISHISDQGAPEFTADPTPQSANGWLKVVPTDLILPPGGHQTVYVTIA